MISSVVVVCVAGLAGANEPPPPPPPLVPAALVTDEDTTLTTTLTVPAGATLKLRKGPKRGTATLDEANARLVFTPNKDVHGDDDVVIEVTVDGRRSNQTLPITVKPINDAPAVDAMTLATKEETATGARLTARDVDNDALSFAIGEPPKNGTATVDKKGNVVFTPGKDATGDSSFTVVVDDGHGGTATAVISVKVAAVNDAPTITATKLAGNEDEAITGAVVGADVDGDVLTYAIGNAPKNGTAAVDAKGQITFQPKANFNGADRFTVVVRDAAGASASAVVEVSVVAVNDAPVARAVSASTAEEAAIDVVVEASDVDGDTLAFKVDAVDNAAVSIDARGRLKITPAKDFNGQLSLAVVVDDGRGGNVTVPVSVRVTPVNDAPQAQPAKLDTSEDKAGSVAIVASDIDGDKLAFSIVTAPKNGRASIDNRGQLTFTPTADFNGRDSVVVAASDSAGAGANAVVEIVVAAVNDAPVVAALKLATDEERPTSARLDTRDIDGDTLAFAIKEAPKKGTATVDAKGTVSYVPTKNENGADRFTVIVTDGKGGSVDGVVDVVIAPVNDRPEAENVSLTVDEDGVLKATLSASDVDGDAVRFILFAPPRNGRADLTRGGALTYTPPRDWHGTDKLVIEVEDGKAWVRADVTLVVTPVNDAPVTQPLSLTTDEDRAVKGNVVARDIDGDKLRYEVKDSPDHGEAIVDATSGRVTYTPAKDTHGKDRFSVAALDGTVETIAVVDVVVAAVPDAPQTFVDTLKAQEDTTIEGTLPAREPDGERLTFALVGEAKLGTVTLLDKHSGRIRYAPRLDENGKDAIAFTATDNITVVNGSYGIDVAAVNDAPVASGATTTTREDTPVEVTIGMTDVDDDKPVVEVVGTVTGARVDVVDGKKGRLRITPSLDKHGTITFKARAVEALASAPVDVTITVEGVNDAPTIKSARFTTLEDTALKGSLVSADVDGDAIAFRLGRAAGRGAVVVDSKTGEFTYTPRGDASGKDSFTVVVKDALGLESTGTVDIDVTAVDDAPIALDGRLRSPRAGRVTGTLVGRDPEGSRLRYVIANQPNLGRVEILDERRGTFAYTAEGGQRSGITTFTFFAEADGKRSVPATVTVEVN